MLGGEDVREFVLGEALYVASNGIATAATAETDGVRPAGNNVRIVKTIHIAIHDSRTLQ